MKRLGIYFFYDKDGVVDEYIPFFLRQLKPFVSELCIVVNGLLSDEGRAKLAPLCEQLLVRQNKGFDAWAYKDAIALYGYDKLAEYDELLLCNYTFFGPFYPLQKLFDDMDKKQCDWWSLFRWYEPVPVAYQHIPSFWTVYRKSLLKSPAFQEFWETLRAVNSYGDSTICYEQRQAPYYDAKGFACATWIDHHKYKAMWNNSWPMSQADRLVIEDKCPFIKRRCFFVEEGLMPEGRVALSVLPYLREHTHYDMHLIWDNLKRTQNLAALSRPKNLAQWLKVLRYWVSSHLSLTAKWRRHYARKAYSMLLDEAHLFELCFGKREGK